jgi:hypothetical protein
MTKKGDGTRRATDRARRIGFRPRVDGMERRVLLTSQTIPPILVTSTSDSATPLAPTPDVPNPLTLRQAITEADAASGPVTIAFDFVPKGVLEPGGQSVVNFNLANQVWTIDVNSPLPPITGEVTIDGYTQKYVTSAENPSAFQKVVLAGNPTGGTFTLTFEGDTTGPIPFNATALQVQTALEALPNIGPGNAATTGGPVNSPTAVVIDLLNAANPGPIQLLTGDAGNLQGLSGSETPPAVSISAFAADIASVPNARTVGFNAEVRVSIDGSDTNVPADFPGLTIESAHNVIRGLAIHGFSVGISLQGPDAIGNLIQGNYLGQYLVFPNQNIATSPSFVAPGIGNGVGIEIGPQASPLPSNNSVGGVSPETHNGIAGNIGQGVVIDVDTNDNQVVGNLIGVLEQDASDYFQVGNGAEGVLVESQSNLIGGVVSGATNVISANQTDGIHIEGPGALDNRVEGNYVGTDINGTYLVGQGDPGNGQDGIFIDDAPDNQIGIPGGVAGVGNLAGNVISDNSGAGVRVSGTSATDNIIQGDVIGTNISGTTALGNGLQGVVLDSADNTVGGTTAGAGNLISANLSGVLVSGAAATGNLIAGNFIGTDGAGAYVLGNSFDGVDIDGASDNTVGGQVAAARNLISGNNVGVLITVIAGPSATNNLVLGNYIGTDVTGLLVLGNENEGVRIEKGASANTIGGTSPTATNVISGNGWGVTITDPNTTGNVVQGNLIGVGADGLTPLGNEIDGVLVENGAANNLIGGLGTGQGNTIAFNFDDGVQINGATSTGNGILSNRIFANGGLGIDLVDGANNNQNAPVLTSLTITSTGVVVQGTLSSMPATSYLIQFFLDAPGNSAINGELLGATTVLTDGNGNASFSVALAVNVPAGDGVVATATDPANNTSKFSNEVVNGPAIIQFSMTNYTVNSAAGVAVITVDRAGGGAGSVSVSYAASGGNATPGVDYTPVSGALTFGLGVTVLSFTVPIIDDPALVTGKTVNLFLTSPTDGATLGTPSSAILTITPGPPPQVPPEVTAVRLTTNRQRIVTGIVVTFSKQLNPTTAVNPLNYNYSVTTAGRDRIFGTRDDLLIPFVSLVYNPTDLSVTLKLGRGIHPPTPFRFAINQLTDVPGAGIGVADLAGNLLSGADNGEAGGAFVVILRGNAGGIVSSTRQAAVTRRAPRSVAAIDAVLEAGDVGHNGVAHAPRGRLVRAIDRRR